ncbi:unnamed protein product [Owenia fusiformis]|uniref:Photolyase/cryptochrome alpha/beta domain-containing protein n=1 Tax=Owenia fusiformis TaxID=6347 RepID=A0A8S4PH89_OWEFU|nr:unnamed protein product [Owenia fusiformis]
MSEQSARTIIYLLRNDLRYHDNQVLSWACQNAEYLVPLYCFDPRNFKETNHFNLQKTGPHKLKFLLESLADLKNTFESKGSNLLIRNGKPETVISELIKVIGKDNVSLAWQEEVTKEKTDVEDALKAL